MKSNELRIGNLVTFNGILCSVSKIDSENFEAKNIEIITEGFRLKTGFQAIPITEEWLIKFGFFKLNPSQFEYSRGEAEIITVIFGKESIYVTFRYVSSDTGFNIVRNQWYVHDLQNLFFSLTGKELTIKEKVS